MFKSLKAETDFNFLKPNIDLTIRMVFSTFNSGSGEKAIYFSRPIEIGYFKTIVDLNITVTATSLRRENYETI